ncbi:MAG: ROK family protein [Chloroflexi bacterium]|nr:ROK family protein [Chloroflexota bacterium]
MNVGRSTADGKEYVVAVDLGGTPFRVALTDLSGRMLDRTSELTQADAGLERVVGRISDAVLRIAAPVGLTSLLGVGVGAPGPLNPRTGILYTPPNLPGWRDVPLRRILEERFGVPVFVGNDANLGALGEHRFGAGRGVDDLVYVTVSTGIGGGVIEDGRLLLGANGLAAEVGHMVLVVDGPQCSCGNCGCLEALASGPSIAREAKERIAAGAKTKITDLVQGHVDQINAEVVVEAARSGDPLAQEVMARAAKYLGIGMLNLVNLFNPKLIAIGGGVSNAEDLILEPIRRIVAQKAMPDFLRDLRIVRSQLGDDVGLLGAVALVLNEAGALKA